jgi:uncharacterized protein (TIGR00725 family)
VKRKITVSVIGASYVKPDSKEYRLSLDLGKKMIDSGYRIITGGMSGIMEAVCQGAKNSDNYQEGDVIGILPGFDPEFSNQYLDIGIATGLDAYRNGIVANSDVVVAMGGGAGTLSEMAFAWVYKRLIIAYNVDGWSGKLAGERIDHRKRIDWEGDKVFKVENENEVVETIQKYLKHYSERHNGIISKMKKDDEI